MILKTEIGEESSDSFIEYADFANRLDAHIEALGANRQLPLGKMEFQEWLEKTGQIEEYANLESENDRLLMENTQDIGMDEYYDYQRFIRLNEMALMDFTRRYDAYLGDEDF